MNLPTELCASTEVYSEVAISGVRKRTEGERGGEGGGVGGEGRERGGEGAEGESMVCLEQRSSEEGRTLTSSP